MSWDGSHMYKIFLEEYTRNNKMHCLWVRETEAGRERSLYAYHSLLIFDLGTMTMHYLFI